MCDEKASEDAHFKKKKRKKEGKKPTRIDRKMLKITCT